MIIPQSQKAGRLFVISYDMASVLVGMSGGVDSSVAAQILKESGYRVTGVSFILTDSSGRRTSAMAERCAEAAVADARDTAHRLGISHLTLDLREAFSAFVVNPFVEAYSRGLTPNPCILCNRHIKFPFLMQVARDRGFDFAATGHYARVSDARLLRAADPAKDQTYVLYTLSRDTLNHLLLPLGTMTKTEVREMAASRGLPAATRPESQEICFVGDRGYPDFLRRATGSAEGPIIDIETGRLLGTHKGLHLYTIGQRKRLVPVGRPVYVARLDPRRNAVLIGPRRSAEALEFTVADLNWIEEPAVTADEGDRRSASWFRATVKVRSTMMDEPARVALFEDGHALVRFDEPQWAPAPGQSAVFYKGESVLGGGVITSLPDHF